MDLELSWFVASVKKSQWHPSQEGIHLGFLVARSEKWHFDSTSV